MINKIKFTKKEISHFKKLGRSKDYLAGRIFLMETLLEKVQEPTLTRVFGILCAHRQLFGNNINFEAILLTLEHNFEEILLILKGKNDK